MKIKKQITDLLWSRATEAHGKGSCGELGDSFMAIDSDSFSDLADELLQNFEPKKCMPEGINSKEEHEEYLKAIGYEKYIKGLEHHKDTTTGLYAIDFDPKELIKRFVDSQSDATRLVVEDVEDLVEDWCKFIENKNIGKSPFFRI